MYSDSSSCELNIQASVENGWMSVTQNLNYTYDESSKEWNCYETTRRGNVSITSLLR